jgi:homoserine kinase
VRVTVRVPASSANLGPGFDCFGLALDLCNEVTVDTDAEPGITWEGEGADELPTDGSDMVSRAIAHMLEQQLRFHPNAELPSFSLHGVNRIPLERGLGSSSAAVVAGVALANALLGEAASSATPEDPYPIFGFAASIEGHPDNAAAAVYGGFTIVVTDLVQRLDPHPDVDPVVLVPERLRLPTAAARKSLAEDVSRRDAVFNVSHASLAVVAFTKDPALLDTALHDRLHEDARLASIPEARDLLHELRQRRQVPSCVSGAGPSLLAFEREGRTVGDLPDGWRAIRPGVRAKGLEVFVED